MKMAIKCVKSKFLRVTEIQTDAKMRSSHQYFIKCVADSEK